MAFFNFDVFGQTTMKDESGQPIYQRDRSERIGIARTTHRRCVLPERNHSRADSSMYTGATVQLDTRSQSLAEPRRVYQVQPDDLSFERRSDMRFNTRTKKGGNMDLKDGPYPRILVHEIQRRTRSLAQIKDGVWWTDSQRESVGLNDLGGCNRRCVGSTDVPCETSVCDLDVLTSWLKA
jgi:hypothetical protein